MKKFLIGLLTLIASLLLIGYIAFIFVLPNMIDISKYKSDLQKIVLDTAHLKLDYENAKITTSPLLNIGVKADKLSIKLSDNSELFTADGFKTRISLPSLLFLTVRVSCAEFYTPKINLEIMESGKGFKVFQIFETIALENEEKLVSNIVPQQDDMPEYLSWIKIKVPALKLLNYNILVNDLKSNHKLTLKGDELVLGYDNGKTFRVKTQAELLSDENKNITADLDIKSFIPEIEPLDEEDDPTQKVVIPFVNPVDIYRTYDLKSNIYAKLKISESKNGLKINGDTNIENLTMKLAHQQLPESYLRSTFKGQSLDIDTNIFIKKNENINLIGNINYSKNPALDIKLKTGKIYFNDVILFAKAFLDNMQVENDLARIKGKGYILADTELKTNFKTFKSTGSIIVRDGSITNKKLNLSLADITANILFNDNVVFDNTKARINGTDLKISGEIDEKSNTDIIVYLEKLPLPQLFNAFASDKMKEDYRLESGKLTVNANVKGQLKNPNLIVKALLNNFSIRDKSNSLVISNYETKANISSEQKQIKGDISNKNLKVLFPQTNSFISNDSLKIVLDGETLTINPSIFKINPSSKVTLSGNIKDYMNSPLYDISAIGKVFANDLKAFAGKEAGTFIDAKGVLPLAITFNGNGHKQTLKCTLDANSENYITPVKITNLNGKNTVLQSIIDFKPNRIKIKDTGLFIKRIKIEEDGTEKINLDDVVAVNGTISENNINLVRVTIPQKLSMSIHGLRNSFLNAEGILFIFGETKEPRIRGYFNLKDISIPSLYLTLNELGMTFKGHDMSLIAKNLSLNGSVLQIDSNISTLPSSKLIINNLKIFSNDIDVDRAMKVSTAAMKLVPTNSSSANNNSSANIPITIKNGNIDIKRLKSDNIVATDTTSKFYLNKNVLHLHNLRTNTFNGVINGKINVNLITSHINIILQGTRLNTERAMLALAGMKDTISGSLNFNTNISLKGATYNEQIQSLKGVVRFSIKKGQFGPFGKIENFLLAENLRNSQVFQSFGGSVISSIATVDTSHFEDLSGTLTFNNGVVIIKPIQSDGNVLSVHVDGKFNLLTNETYLVVRGRLASIVSDMLGPISLVNPVNLIKNTPGLNVGFAKSFSIFCQEITPEEMKLIPSLANKYTERNATKFQVILDGNIEKPLSLVKSFKWLALASEIASAQTYADSLIDVEAIEAQKQKERESKWLYRLFNNKNNDENIKKENILEKEIQDEIKSDEKQNNFSSIEDKKQKSDTNKIK